MTFTQDHSPNQTESFLLGDVIDANLFHGSRVVFARLEEVYLEAHFDLLGEGTLREDSLHLRHHSRRHHPTLWSNSMYLR